MIQNMENGFSKIDKFNIFFGFIFIVMYSTPISSYVLKNILWLQELLSSKYIPFPYCSFIYSFLKLLLNTLFVVFLFRKLKIYDRLHPEYSSTTLFTLGNIFIVIHTFTAKIWYLFPELDIKNDMLAYNNYAMVFAKLLLFIACSRVFIGMKTYYQESAI